jgi:hypothetical protein
VLPGQGYCGRPDLFSQLVQRANRPQPDGGVMARPWEVKVSPGDESPDVAGGHLVGWCGLALELSDSCGMALLQLPASLVVVEEDV